MALALTSRLWLPAIPTLFGAIEANGDLIGAFADLATVATFAILLAGGVLTYLGYRNLQTANNGSEARQSAVFEHGGRGAATGNADRAPGGRPEAEAGTPGPQALARAITELREGFDRFQRERTQRGLDRMPRHGALEVAAAVDGTDAPGGSPTEEFLNRLGAANPGYTGWPLWFDARGRGAGDEPYTLDGGWEALLYEYEEGSPYNHLDFWRADPAGRFYAYRGFEDDLSEGPSYPEAMTTLDFGMAIWRVAEAIAVPMASARYGVPPGGDDHGLRLPLVRVTRAPALLVDEPGQVCLRATGEPPKRRGAAARGGAARHPDLGAGTLRAQGHLRAVRRLRRFRARPGRHRGAGRPAAGPGTPRGLITARAGSKAPRTSQALRCQRSWCHALPYRKPAAC